MWNVEFQMKKEWLIFFTVLTSKLYPQYVYIITDTKLPGMDLV